MGMKVGSHLAMICCKDARSERSEGLVVSCGNGMGFPSCDELEVRYRSNGRLVWINRYNNSESYKKGMTFKVIKNNWRCRMAKLTTMVLASYVLRGEDGEMDIEGTVDKFRSDLLNYQVERETEAATIGAAVNAVFDEHPGARINMPALQSLALHKLNVQHENFKALQTRVAEYIRDHASHDRSEGRLFKISKGLRGGVLRWSDEPVSDSE